MTYRAALMCFPFAGAGPSVTAALVPAHDIALFGHSFGGLMAYETAVDLAGDDQVPLVHLIVSGCLPPGTRPARRVSHLPDDQFLAALPEVTCPDHPALRHTVGCTGTTRLGVHSAQSGR